MRLIDVNPVRTSTPFDLLRTRFGDAFQENVPLAGYTTARVGGPADGLLTVNSSSELERAACMLWKNKVPFVILGNGSNVLVSDTGLRGVVLLNRARKVKVENQEDCPTIWAESGANLSSTARKATLEGLGGMEWAAAIPGSVGGAVIGNAGAFGSNTAANLVLAEILHPIHGKEIWSVDRMEYDYRTSLLKRNPHTWVVLAARFRLEKANRDEVVARMEQFLAQRRSSQPPGASMGSMFKNPPGDHAGRLIEAAGLKGSRVGGAEISPMHANFFINTGGATAADIHALIDMARRTVFEKFNVQLELEVELLGEWNSKVLEK